MADFNSIMAQKQNLSEDDQKKAGAPVSGGIGDKYKEFLKTVIGLIDSGEINVLDPQSFLNKDVYDGLDEGWKEQTDLALVNITQQLRMIDEFYRSKKTPDESPQLETMIEQLWQTKQRIEETHDVFKF